MIKQIAIINKSTVVSNIDVAKMASACNTQLSRDVAPVWSRLPISVVAYTAESSVPVGSAKVYIFDSTDQMGALGYHSETMGMQVYGKVFAKTIVNYGLPILYNPNNKNSITVSTVLSHEVIELFVNPYVNLWSDGPTIPEGNEYVFEACDPVEADVYQITVSTKPSVIVSVSNFVYPEYFDIASKNIKLDYMNLLKTPFTMTKNGYMVVRGINTITPIYGATYPQALKEMRKVEI